jgi:lathosterol oxidase
MSEIDWSSLCMWMGISISGGLIIFHGVAAFYHVKYYVLRADEPENWKCQPNRRLPANLQRHAILLSSWNLTIAGAITGAILYAVQRGMQTPVYYDVADYGWAYTLLSTVVLFVFVDAIAYYIHRALHGKFLYSHFHRAHHAYVATTPYCTIAIHPLVFVSLQLGSFAPVALIPFHAASVAIVFLYILIFNIIDHSGVRLVSRIPWQAPSDYHDDHHALFHVNFGQHLMIWDRLHGTLRKKEQSYGVEVFGGRGESAKAGAPGSDDIIRY